VRFVHRGLAVYASIELALFISIERHAGLAHQTGVLNEHITGHPLARIQRALEKIEAILPPERFVSINVERGAEHLPLDRFAGILSVAVLHFGGVGAGKQRSAVMT
jgi:hypothetical protein